MRNAIGFGVVMLALGSALTLEVAADATIGIKVTQRDLVARCFNARAVDTGTREWKVEPGPVALAFSMRSRPRPGGEAAESGTAAIAFTAEAGHRYEVEVRADPAVYSSRVWRKGEWIPVVRDRTTDRIVSDEARWVASACSEPLQ